MTTCPPTPTCGQSVDTSRTSFYRYYLGIRCDHLHSAVWLLTFHGGQ